MELENRGIPTVTFAEEDFEKPAKMQARVLGVPSLPVVVIAQPRPWHDEKFHEEETEKRLPEVVRGLTESIQKREEQKRR